MGYWTEMISRGLLVYQTGEQTCGRGRIVFSLITYTKEVVVY